LAFSPKGRWLVIVTKDYKLYMEDVHNDFIKKREFTWSDGIVLASIFDSENEFYLVGIKHFSVWAVDTMQ